MALMASLLLFTVLAALGTWVGAHYWLQPKAVVERLKASRSAAAETAEYKLPHPSLAFRDLMARLGTVLPTSPKEARLVQKRLIRAGFRNQSAVKIFYGSKLLFSVLLPAVAALVGGGGENQGLLTLSSGLLGFMAPGQLLKMAGKRRQKQIRRALPNALDLLVICVESGLGLDQAIVQTAKELENAHPEISEEFALVNLELRAGKRRVEALRNLADRSAVDELKKLVAVLIQADRFGTGIAGSLRGHADYLRVQARQAAEEKAAKLGIKLTFPIFFCILPSLFVVTVGPMVVRIMRDVLPMMRDM
jgi:tight adherence protein C